MKQEKPSEFIDSLMEKHGFTKMLDIDIEKELDKKFISKAQARKELIKAIENAHITKSVKAYLKDMIKEVLG